MDALAERIKGSIDELIQEASLGDCVVFLDNGTILYKNMEFEVNKEELRNLVHLFEDEQNAISCGMKWNGALFEIHRWYPEHHPGLIYGRTPVKQSNSEYESEGFAICRTKPRSLDENVYIIITYKLPTLSARAVSRLAHYCKNNIETS